MLVYINNSFFIAEQNPIVFNVPVGLALHLLTDRLFLVFDSYK